MFHTGLELSIRFLNTFKSHSYSVRRLFTGFAIAAFIARNPMVRVATESTSAAATPNIHQDSSYGMQNPVAIDLLCTMQQASQ